MKETGGKGHILSLLGIYDRLKMNFPDIPEWRYRKDREELFGFHKTFIKQDIPLEPIYSTTARKYQDIGFGTQHMSLGGGNIRLIEYSADLPKIGNDLETDPYYDVKAVIVREAWKIPGNVYITVYQLHGQTIYVYKTKNDMDIFERDIFAPALEALRNDKTGEKATINLSCPQCVHKKLCIDYQTYCDSLGKQKDLISLLLRRSILNGQRMECADEMWRVTKLITQQIEQSGQIEHQGIKFYLRPKIKRRWDSMIVKDILSKEGLWNDGMMRIDEGAIEKLLERNPELIAKMQHAIVYTETSYELKGENDKTKKRLINL